VVPHIDKQTQRGNLASQHKHWFQFDNGLHLTLQFGVSIFQYVCGYFDYLLAAFTEGERYMCKWCVVDS